MPIVYFDGECNLCNSMVDLLRRLDRRDRLKFAPLQGETARARLPAEVVATLGSMVFEDERGVTVGSTAVIRTLVALGGVYVLFGVFLFIPRFAREPLYRFVARHRYRWFGRR